MKNNAPPVKTVENANKRLANRTHQNPREQIRWLLQSFGPPSDFDNKQRPKNTQQQF